MGYSAMLLLPSVMLLPFVSIGAGLVYWGALRLRFAPSGVPGIVTWPLIGCMAYGLFYLAVTVDMLIDWPARLQTEYVGRVYGTPLSLRSFEQTGFQDPHSEWRYALDSAEVASLSDRCKSTSPGAAAQGCLLFSESDDRWFASVEVNGAELRVSEGLW